MEIRKYTDVTRRRLYFEFFIRHFVIMSKASTNFRSLSLAKIYVKHAELLCQILMDDANNRDIALEFLKEITPISEKIENLRNRGSYAVPELPRRESMLDPQLRQPWRRNTTTLPKMIDEDPYTNIVDLSQQLSENGMSPTKSSHAIQPVDEYSNSSEDESNADNGQNQLRTTIRHNGAIPNGIVEVAQVHSIPSSNEYEFNGNAIESDVEDDVILSKILGNISTNGSKHQKTMQNDIIEKVNMDEILGNVERQLQAQPSPPKKKSVAFTTNDFKMDDQNDTDEEDTSF